ncbi:MAG: AbrB/MazE/SpoVT family DNA-binding domain-containing protein [Gemmatimonadetes bacterium]|nr:AbrB/MazE/SpoVT family DNA-binding domain-containing protein [Gemmatimonadota bacterium]
MISRVQKWGNSQGLPLPKALLAEAGLRVGSEVELVVKHGALVITPFQRRRGGHHLRTLVRRLPAALIHRSGSRGHPQAGKPGRSAPHSAFRRLGAPLTPPHTATAAPAPHAATR